MDTKVIHEALSHFNGLGGNVYIPEFSWGDLRIDALIVNTRKRLVRGFEIKTRKGDFVRDTKWTLYSQFCYTLCIACPEGLIAPEQVGWPFGLVYVTEASYNRLIWIKRPRPMQDRNSLSWLWVYTRILEQELPRLAYENDFLKQRLGYYTKSPAPQPEA